MTLTRRTLNLVAAIAALLLMSLLVWQTSSAAFTGTTDEDITVDAGSIDLTDDDAASIGFTPVLFPGSSESACVTVTYDQTPATPVPSLNTVRVYGSYTDGGTPLSSVVDIQIDEGCVGGTPIIGSGTIAAEFAAAFDYTTGQGTWTPSADLETQDYLITFSMDSSVTDAAQGGSVDVTVTWEVQTS